MTVEAEVAIDERRSRAAVERGHEVIADIQILGLGVLVAELAFEPEHPEVVTRVQIDVVAGLVADGRDLVRTEVLRPGVGEVDEAANMLAPREQDAAV